VKVKKNKGLRLCDVFENLFFSFCTFLLHFSLFLYIFCRFPSDFCDGKAKKKVLFRRGKW
jgi:hypothetical protein